MLSIRGLWFFCVSMYLHYSIMADPISTVVPSIWSLLLWQGTMTTPLHDPICPTDHQNGNIIINQQYLPADLGGRLGGLRLLARLLPGDVNSSGSSSSPPSKPVSLCESKSASDSIAVSLPLGLSPRHSSSLEAPRYGERVGSGDKWGDRCGDLKLHFGNITQQSTLVITRIRKRHHIRSDNWKDLSLPAGK